jgi:hypothetical protein
MAKQPLHSLDRFRKRSGRLVLEQHSSEVPVGCGGVVLRWRNPQAAVPLSFSVYSPGKVTVLAGGLEITETGLDLPPGTHQVALAIEDVDLAGGLFMLVVWHDPKRYERLKELDGLKEVVWKVVSEPSGAWRATLDEPPPAWTQADFDESGWRGLTRKRANPRLDWRQQGAWQAHRCNDLGASFLMLDSKVKGEGKVWVRKRLVVPGPIGP